MAKVTISNQRNVLKKLQKDADKKTANALFKSRDELIKAIKSEISRGKSPVVNERWKPYSEDYANRYKGGSKTPVNMKQTGDMLDSLEMRKIRNKIDIFFGSFIAVFHDQLGAGKNKVIRRLLPDPSKGERFNTRLTRIINKIIKRGLGS